VTGVNRESVRPSRRRREAEIRFPYAKLSGWVILLIIGGLFVYRLSETGGKPSQTACLSAMAVSFLAAFAGLIPIYKAWGKDLFGVIIGIFLSGLIRLLISFLGTVIIALFTDILRIQFVGFLGLFYVALLAIDIWLALWILRNTKFEKDEDQETVIHGNIWDIISRSRKPT
jgi:hypothetical protein